MSANADRQAFPLAYTEDSDFTKGLTKREYFAAMAMQGLWADANEETHRQIRGASKAHGISPQSIVAKWAVDSADALLAELEKK
jgi:hypothetical protein